MQLPVGGQFARDGAVVASQKGNVTTGTSRITGHFYSTLAALRLDRPWRASHMRNVAVEAKGECDSGQLRAMFLFALG